MENQRMGNRCEVTERMRVLGLVGLIMIGFLLSACMVYGTDAPEYVKVGLKYGSGAGNSCTLESANGFQMMTNRNGELEETLPISAYTALTATVENGEVVLKDRDSGTIVSASLGKNDCIMSMNDGATITCDGTSYRDGIQLLISGGNKLTVINYVSMEHYLYGVLPGEMGTGFPLEALKAQAVAARSYAEANLTTHRSSGFEVCDTTHCQMYKAYAGENAKTNQAVDETAGLMLYADGKPAPGYYHKNSGGYTQNSEDVWNGKTSYLKAVKDIYSPDYSWNATMTFDELATRLANTGNGVGTVKSIGVTKRNESGAVAELTIVGTSKTVVLKKEKTRTGIGGTWLKSTQYYLTGEGAVSGEKNDPVPDVYVTNGNGKQMVGATVCVLGASGGVQETKRSNLHLWNGQASEPVTAGGSVEANFGQQDFIIDGGSVTFLGKGSGHGIGMAQDSALQMAQKGMNFREILEFFYHSITIK